MKVGKTKISWKDDNHVDFSRKHRVYRKNSLISSRFDSFSPEDLVVGNDNWEGNPSVNKRTYELSNEVRDSLNDKEYLLNKGVSDKKRPSSTLDSFFDRVERDIIEDLSIDD